MSDLIGRAKELTDPPAEAVEAAAKAAYEQHRDHADEWPWGMVFARTQEGWRNYARLTLRAGVPALLDRLTAAETENTQLRADTERRLAWADGITRHECHAGVHEGWWDRCDERFLACPWCALAALVDPVDAPTPREMEAGSCPCGHTCIHGPHEQELDHEPESMPSANSSRCSTPTALIAELRSLRAAVRLDVPKETQQ